ncbi:MAG: hypothetical protein IK025_02995 [Bacteroidales bacterium]|nr:hypothetical protein [Bacteroidales bacterium]
MKKNLILTVFCLIISAMTFAQVPQKMSYQAVVRGSDNNLVINSEVSVRVSILQGSVDGEAVYTETHSATTNANGLLTIEIGNGTSNNDFSAINWANGPYFVKTETDVNGGDDYDIIGVSQLLAVPYAMYAQSAGNMPDVSGFLTEETQTLADVVSVGNSANAQLKDVIDPTDNQDAATKKYVDDIIVPILAQNAELRARIEEIEHFNYMVSLNAHEYVDLGLPSGTKWATCNIGAISPEDYGDYFAWGETTSKDIYSWATYILCNGTNSTLTKYCNNSSYGNNGLTDALTTFEASDDAATANWGSAWRMPTKEEFEELDTNCTVTWTTQNGVKGRLFTSDINGNSIFLPAAGRYDGSSLNAAGTDGYYWSSSLDTDGPRFALYLYFYQSGCYPNNSNYRYYGRSVRAVVVE